jgi:hypothetical protein
MKLTVVITLLMTLVCGTESALSAESEPFMVQIAQRKNSQGDPLITTVGMYGVNGNTALHIDLAKYDDAERGEAWAAELGGGFLLPTRVNIFVGGGIVVGYRSNDGEYFAAWYPELGAVVHLTDGLGISISRKRYQKLYQRTEDVLMFGLVLALK